MARTEAPSDGARPSRAPPFPDAHGQAALLLAESTLHSLLEAGVLTRAQVLAAVRVAGEVKEEVAEATGEPRAAAEASRRLLEAIGRSLAADGDGRG